MSVYFRKNLASVLVTRFMQKGEDHSNIVLFKMSCNYIAALEFFLYKPVHNGRSISWPAVSAGSAH